MPRAWLVGQNEAALIGDGWYDRAPSWYGFPFRESFPQATLRIHPNGAGDTLHLFVASPLAVHKGTQWIDLSIEGTGTSGEVPRKTRYELVPSSTESPWNVVSCRLSGFNVGSQRLLMHIECEGWRHGDWEQIADFRPVGIVFGGMVLREG